MQWLDYNISQMGKNFSIDGDWPGEVMGVRKDGSSNDHWLYKPGDQFVANKDGVLIYVGNETDNETE